MYIKKYRLKRNNVDELHHRLLQMLLSENKSIQSKPYRHIQAITMNNFFANSNAVYFIILCEIS